MSNNKNNSADAQLNYNYKRELSWLPAQLGGDLASPPPPPLTLPSPASPPGGACAVLWGHDRVPQLPPHLTGCREDSALGCSPRVTVTTSVDSHLLLPPCLLFHGSRFAGVGPGLVDAPSHLLCVAPVCGCVVCGVVCVWMGIARVCRSRPVPTCEGLVCRVSVPA